MKNHEQGAGHMTKMAATSIYGNPPPPPPPQKKKKKKKKTPSPEEPVD